VISVSIRDAAPSTAMAVVSSVRQKRVGPVQRDFRLPQAVGGGGAGFLECRDQRRGIVPQRRHFRAQLRRCGLQARWSSR
jgi:hypothetical protein